MGTNLVLSVGMGLGKTAAVLHYVAAKAPQRVLIVAPKRVAETVWLQEAQKWSLYTVADKMVIVKGTAAQRAAALKDDSKPYKIISRDNLKDVVYGCYDLLIIDELTSFKNLISIRSENIRTIKATQKIGLTGTFLANGAIDIYGQLAAVGITDAHIFTKRSWKWCPEFNAWRDTYFYDAMYGSGQPFHKWKCKVPLEQLISIWKNKIFTLDSADYLEIPDVTYTQHKVELTNDESNNYTQLSAMLSVNIDGDTLEVKEGAKFAKLQTLCNGFIYDTATGEAMRMGYSSKLEAVADFIESCVGEGEPVLLFYAFREEAIWLADLLSKRLITYASTKDTTNIQKWLKGEISVLMAHPASAGHGLNLQDGGRICVWSSITYNYEYWAQANARLARQGQKKKVQIHIFTAKDTIEEKQLLAVRKKETTDKEFVKLTKE